MQASSADTPVGAATMSPAMARMGHYPHYLLGNVEGILGQRVLEIGVGFGQYTKALRTSGRAVLATDVDTACIEEVRRKFAGDPDVTVGPIDLNDEASVRQYASYRADSILCLNVLEHIEDDRRAARWLRESVVPGAGLGLIVPAHPGLYGKMDREAGHYRRYTRRSLAEVLESGGWNVVRLRYLNVLGGVGWWVHNRLRKNAGLADAAVNSQMARADRWLPLLAKATDPLFSHLCGLSVLAWARA